MLAFLAAGGAVAVGAAALLAHLSTARLRVEQEKLTAEPVRRGTFQEYLLVPATVHSGTAGPEIRAAVDRSAAPRLTVGQQGEATIEGRRHGLEVGAIGAVAGHDATVTLHFVGAPPRSVTAGTALYVRLDLGAPAAALLLARGSFFQATGGHWVWVVDESGSRAHKRPVRLGRQNPEVYEVLGGLTVGERVITSTYDHLEGADELVLIP